MAIARTKRRKRYGDEGPDGQDTDPFIRYRLRWCACLLSDRMSCDVCRLPLDEEYMTLGNGKTLHPECFRCSKCKKQIQGGFFTEPIGWVCSTCGSQASTTKRCFQCRQPLVGEYRIFRAREYCKLCAEKVQEAEVDQRKVQYENVIAERERVEEHNRRLANRAAQAPTYKFDYKERQRWEREEREKAGYPEPERKW